MTTSTFPALDLPVTDGPIVALWAEVTGKCQLSCVHCYADSGPDGTHGTMTAERWKEVLTEAAALGTRMVCFIGGEPTMYPELPALVRHALSLGMGAEVFSNLVYVAPGLWELFETPGVRLATSWYSSDRAEHKQVTGRDTWRQTLANIEEVVRRGIALRVGLIDGIIPGQHADDGAALLRSRGVVNIGGDYLREFGRGTNPDPSQACGNCGQGRAAVLPDGTVTPCPLTRWMAAGNVTGGTSLAAVLPAVRQLADGIPAVQRRKGGPPCKPMVEEPDCKPKSAERVDSGIQDGTPPECRPDCWPNCYPGNMAAKDECTPHCWPSCAPYKRDQLAGTPDDCSPHTCSPFCTPANRLQPASAVAVQACYPDDC